MVLGWVFAPRPYILSVFVVFLCVFSSEVATESPHGTKNAKNSHIFDGFAARNCRIVGLISVRLPSCHPPVAHTLEGAFDPMGCPRIHEITQIFERFAARKCLKMSVFKRFVKEKLPFSTIQRVSLDNLPEADPRLWRGLNNLLNSRWICARFYAKICAFFRFVFFVL